LTWREYWSDKQGYAYQTHIILYQQIDHKQETSERKKTEILYILKQQMEKPNLIQIDWTRNRCIDSFKRRHGKYMRYKKGDIGQGKHSRTGAKLKRHTQPKAKRVPTWTTTNHTFPWLFNRTGEKWINEKKGRWRNAAGKIQNRNDVSTWQNSIFYLGSDIHQKPIRDISVHSEAASNLKTLKQRWKGKNTVNLEKIFLIRGIGILSTLQCSFQEHFLFTFLVIFFFVTS